MRTMSPYFHTKACCVLMQTDWKIYTRGAVKTFAEERTALASLQTPVFTIRYAYRNCWPRSIILQFRVPFLGQFGKLYKKKNFAMSVRPSARNSVFPLERYSLSLDYRLDDLGFDSWQKQDFSLFFETSRPATGHTQSPIQGIPGVPSPGVKLPEDEQNTHLHRIRGYEWALLSSRGKFLPFLLLRIKCGSNRIKITGTLH